MGNRRARSAISLDGSNAAGGWADRSDLHLSGRAAVKGLCGLAITRISFIFLQC
jgi:hypothetical protein